MYRKIMWTALVAVPLAIGGLVYAVSQPASQPTDEQPAATDGGYVCPITGETLPCENCCPLNAESQAVEQSAAESDQQLASEDGYVCPLTGETLPCENCCPLKK